MNNKRLIVSLGLIGIFVLSPSSYAAPQEHDFVEAYIRSLSCQRRIEEKSRADLLEAGNNESKKNMALMRSSQRGILELTTAINYLVSYQSSSNKIFSQVSQTVVESYQYMIRNYKEGLRALEIMNNPANANNPNFDIGKMMSVVSGLTAKQEYLSIVAPVV